MPQSSMTAMRLDGHDDFDVLAAIDGKRQYPPGLTLVLNEQVLQKLGIPPGQPQTGQMVTVKAMAKVVSTREEDETLGASRTVELQITAMTMNPVGGINPGPVIYPGTVGKGE